jgi:hypothetical protein
MLVSQKAKQLSSMGWDGFQCQMCGWLLSKEKIGEKFVLSLEKELGYERIIIKLEEVGGGGVTEKGKKLLQKRKLD